MTYLFRRPHNYLLNDPKYGLDQLVSDENELIILPSSRVLSESPIILSSHSGLRKMDPLKPLWS